MPSVTIFTTTITYTLSTQQFSQCPRFYLYIRIRTKNTLLIVLVLAFPDVTQKSRDVSERRCVLVKLILAVCDNIIKNEFRIQHWRGIELRLRFFWLKHIICYKCTTETKKTNSWCISQEQEGCNRREVWLFSYF